MKYKIFTFFIFNISCSSHYTKIDNRNHTTTTGFAYIYNEKIYELKNN